MSVTVDDVIEWGQLDTGNVTSTELIQRVLDATKLFIAARYELLDADAELWDESAQLALIMQTARLYKRRRSPEGVAGFGDIGIIRISRVDPDVAELLARFYVPSIAGAGGAARYWNGSYWSYDYDWSDVAP